MKERAERKKKEKKKWPLRCFSGRNATRVCPQRCKVGEKGRKKGGGRKKKRERAVDVYWGLGMTWRGEGEGKKGRGRANLYHIFPLVREFVVGITRN